MVCIHAACPFDLMSMRQFFAPEQLFELLQKRKYSPSDGNDQAKIAAVLMCCFLSLYIIFKTGKQRSYSQS